MFQENSLNVGVVVCSHHRPATPAEVWVQISPRTVVAVNDLLLIDSPRQQLLGAVVDMEIVGEQRFRSEKGRIYHEKHITWAKVAVLSTSDERRRPPDGTTVRRPHPAEVTNLLAEARQISVDLRVPLGVLQVNSEFAPVYAHLNRLVGPTATSALISGAAGSLKSTAGVLVSVGIAQVTQGRAALVLVNSKGNDFLFADHGRQSCSNYPHIPPLRDRDLQIYTSLGYTEPPVLLRTTAFVPGSDEISWHSARPLDFPGTQPYQISYEAAIRYACSPTDAEERASSIITRQCIEEATGPFANETGATSLHDLVLLLEDEFLSMVNERSRWRNQFQATTVAAALRQLRAAARDLGPIIGMIGEQVAFPVEELATGGTWIVDVAPLPQPAAQAVIDELVTALWSAKANGTIPNNLPLVLLVDELNRWTTTGPTAARLAAIVRDQRHRQFSLIGLAQQLSTLHPQLLANVDTLWVGNTHSRELSNDTYNHFPQHVREQLHRLPQGQRVLDTWPLAQPLIVEVPYPSWLIGDEGLAVVDTWKTRGRPYDNSCPTLSRCTNSSFYNNIRSAPTRGKKD